MGKYLARRYGKFLGNGTYLHEKIHMLSSDRDRTINSAELVLAGMFPPKGDQIWNEELNWQPIAVHTIPKSIDYYLHVESGCARYLKARRDYEVSPEMQALIEPHKELFQYVEKHTGNPVRTIENMKNTWKTLKTERKMNKM